MILTNAFTSFYQKSQHYSRSFIASDFFLCSMNREFIDASGYYRVFCEDLLAYIYVEGYSV